MFVICFFIFFYVFQNLSVDGVSYKVNGIAEDMGLVSATITLQS